MSCRSTPFSSALTTMAQIKYKSTLPPELVLKIFHNIKKTESFSRWAVYHPAVYTRLIDKKIAEVNAASTRRIPETQKQTLLARLAEAKASSLPDSLVHFRALESLDRETARVIKGIKKFTQEIAGYMDLEQADTLAHFIELASNLPHNYTIDKETLRKVNYEARSNNIVLEDSFLYALETMMAEKDAYRKKLVRSGSPRIVQEPIGERESGAAGIKDLVLTHFGYDPRNKRLEVTILNEATGKSKSYAYTRIDNDLYKDFLESNDKGKYWKSNIRGNHYHYYDDALEAKMAGIAPKCTSCGQFAAVDHGCPSLVEPIVLKKDGFKAIPFANKIENGNKVGVPSGQILSDALSLGAVKIEGITGYTRDREYLNGDLTLYLNEQNEIKANISQIYCTCRIYNEMGRCNHISIVSKVYIKETQAVVDSLSQASVKERIKLVAKAQQRILEEEENAAKRLFDTDWTRKESTLNEAKKGWQEDSAVLYSEDFAKFKKIYNKAINARKKEGNAVVPYMKNNALDGMATRQSGQGFGVELEYEFPDAMNWQDIDSANRAIGRKLAKANLVKNSEQMGYHFARSNGYVDVHRDSDGYGTWTFENDGSVSGGEIVSPIMYDEPDTWENLEKVLDIIKSCGGIPTVSAGSHVHVSTKMYGQSVKKYSELTRLANQHEDVLYRLASDPNRGSHRGTGFAEPNKALNPVGFKSIKQVQTSADRYSALNFASISGGEKDNVEFRLFDSTLDPGTIQGQIKIAVAMTHAATRINRKGGTKRNKEELGAHRKRIEFLKEIKETQSLEDETSTFRSLLDTLFLRVEDKNQLISIFANTKWAKQSDQ